MVDFRKILIAYINDAVLYHDKTAYIDLIDREGMDWMASSWVDMAPDDFKFIGSSIDGLNREEMEALLRAVAEAPEIKDASREKLLAMADLLLVWKEPGHG